MNVYQLVVSGPNKSATQSHAKRYSRKVFSTPELAIAYLPEFTAVCCGEGLWDLEAVTEHEAVALELWL